MQHSSKVLGALLLGITLAHGVFANENDGYVNTCLNAWGDHPFGNKPHYKTLASSVKLFGIGQNIDDNTVTRKPELVLIDTGVNIMGGSTMNLMNPNGWYCFVSNVNVMGGLTIKTHCKSHLASASNGVTVLGGDTSNKTVTVFGSTNVEVEGCK